MMIGGGHLSHYRRTRPSRILRPRDFQRGFLEALWCLGGPEQILRMSRKVWVVPKVLQRGAFTFRVDSGSRCAVVVGRG